MTLTVDVNDLAETVQRQSGSWYAKVLAGIMWFLIGDYELFGFGYFFATFFAGGFAAYAAHRLLPD